MKKKWKKKETDILKAGRKAGSTYKQIQRELEAAGFKRSWNSIRQKADHADIKLEAPLALSQNFNPAAIESCYSIQDIKSVLSEMGKEATKKEHKEWKAPEGFARELFINISDVHIGPEYKNLRGTVTHSPEIACKKINKVFDNAHNMIRHNDYDFIILNLFGDLCDGEDIYPAQATLTKAFSNEQTIIAAELFLDNIKALWESHQKPVKINCVYGNHGRSGKTTHYLSNWDMVVYNMIRIALQEYVSYSDANIEINISESETLLYRSPCGHEIMLTHIGPVQDATSAREVLLANWKHRFDYDCLIYGHVHKPGILDYMGLPIIRNGSVSEADTKFCRQKGYGGRPTQIMFTANNQGDIASGFEAVYFCKFD